MSNLHEQLPKYGDIQINLTRNVITEPLYGKIALQQQPGAAGSPQLFDVIIDVNLDYYGGRDAAFNEVADLASAVVKNLGRELGSGRLPTSLGSRANPYMTARLPGDVIAAMVQMDFGRARDRELKGRTTKEAQEPGQPAPPTESPTRLRPYLAIYRIWEDFAINPLIDRSVSTVKADAARRAFLAEGKDIIWAVIDSGIDHTHEHFLDLETLNVAQPIVHCDFTVENGVNSATALVDKFGHGTHVAGIIAGALVKPRSPRAEAIRTRLDASGEITTYTDPLDQIAGMAPSCKLVSMKVLDEQGRGTVSRIIAALDQIQQINDHGRRPLIHGVNLSVGYEFDPAWFACGQSPICVEVNRLVRSGVVVVVAAGNTGYGTVAASARNTGGGLALTINDPGNADLAITVGSTHRDMPHTYGVSYFSSKGPTGDGRIKPDLVAPGERILSCASTKDIDGASTCRYVEDTGTSMAAPHVSGVIAAFLSIRREYINEPEKVKELFMSTATDLKRDRYFQGQGLVDLMRAIQAI